MDTELYATLAPKAIISSTDIIIQHFDYPSFNALAAFESDAELPMIDRP